MKKSHKTIKVNKEWIENLKKPGWQRNIYPSRVNKFVKDIRDGTFERTTLIISKRDDGDLVLLDGGHKCEAIIKTDTKFLMDVFIYEGLTEEQEKRQYQVHNDIKHPRIIDDIHFYLGDHDWLDAFLDTNNFPIEVTERGGIDSIRIDRFLNILKNGMMQGSYRQNLSRKNLPIFLETLDSEVYATMKEFCSLYKKCFGDPYRENWLYRNTIMYNLMKVWMANKDEFTEEDIIKRFKPIENNGSIKMDSMGVDIVTLQSLIHKIYALINKGRPVNKFKEFWIEDEE